MGSLLELCSQKPSWAPTLSAEGALPEGIAQSSQRLGDARAGSKRQNLVEKHLNNHVCSLKLLTTVKVKQRRRKEK